MTVSFFIRRSPEAQLEAVTGQCYMGQTGYHVPTSPDLSQARPVPIPKYDRQKAIIVAYLTQENPSHTYGMTYFETQNNHVEVHIGPY